MFWGECRGHGEIRNISCVSILWFLPNIGKKTCSDSPSLGHACQRLDSRCLYGVCVWGKGKWMSEKVTSKYHQKWNFYRLPEKAWSTKYLVCRGVTIIAKIKYIYFRIVQGFALILDVFVLLSELYCSVVMAPSWLWLYIRIPLKSWFHKQEIS